MFSVDEFHGRIYAMHFRDFRHPGDEIDVSDLSTPRGLHTDGETMWVVDAGASNLRKLIAYNLDDGGRDSSKDVSLRVNHRNPWLPGRMVRLSG
jgi:hypothetical protein